MSEHNRLERYLQIIIRPHISEKTTLLADSQRQYGFEVRLDANKGEIKNAVEHLFKVKVDSVRVLNVHGKQKVFKQIKGRRKNWKKAYVKLAEGHEIQFGGSE